MTTNPNSNFTRRMRSLVSAFLLVATGAFTLTRIVAAAGAMGGRDRVEGQCTPILLLVEAFDTVTPPILPTGWSSTMWVTSNSGVPMPPADTFPNAAFVNDPATISFFRQTYLFFKTAAQCGCLSATTSTYRMGLMVLCLKSALMMA